MKPVRTWLAATCAALAMLAAAPASAAWMEARTAHFVVLSNDQPAAVIAMAKRLERFDAGMRRLHQLEDTPGTAANPLTVYVLPDMQAVAALCRGGNQRRGCMNVAGFYDGRATGSVAFMPRRGSGGSRLDLQAETILFHEYGHHIMLANYSGVYPAWFVEGFAEFNSVAQMTDEAVGFGLPPGHRFAGLLLGAKLPIRQLLTAHPATLNPAQRDLLYGQGWLLTHYLTFETRRGGQLEAYLSALNAGKPNLAAAEAAFGDLNQLERELNAYLRRKSISYANIKVPPVPDDAVTLRALSAGEAALMPVRLRSDRGVDDKTAAELVVEARRRAAPFPNDPAVQTVLAEAEYDAGNDTAAEAAANRALAADPKARGAMLYKGRARVRMARAAKADAAAFAEARRWFVRANKAVPDDAEPLLLFYTSFLAASETPTENAVAGLTRAFDLAPQDDGLRMLLALQLIRDKDVTKARAVLAPLAFNPHAAPDNPAAAMIARIDAGETAIVTAEANASAK